MRLREAVTFTEPPRIDEAAGIIYGVRVLDERSKNKRVYPRGTRERAHQIIEGARVNIDHLAKDKRGHDVPLGSRFGKLINVREGADGTVADLKFLRHHFMAPQILELAREMPEMLGMSINGVGTTTTKDAEGNDVIESLDSLRSVDLVADSAATRGLLESEEYDDDEDEEGSGDHYWDACVKSIIDMMHEDIPVEDKVKHFRSHMRHYEKASGIGKPQDDSSSEGEEVVEESVQPQRVEPGQVVDVDTGEDMVQIVQLCESMQVDADTELLEALKHLPPDQRKTHLEWLKRKLVARKPKSGAPVVVQESQQAPANEKPEQRRQRQADILRAM